MGETRRKFDQDSKEGVVRQASPAEPELAALGRQIAERRAADMRLFAADIVWATNTPELYQLLRHSTPLRTSYVRPRSDAGYLRHSVSAVQSGAAGCELGQIASTACKVLGYGAAPPGSC